VGPTNMHALSVPQRSALRIVSVRVAAGKDCTLTLIIDEESDTT